MGIHVDEDHWDFLEEIEAPMWTDLSLEAKSNVHNIGEDEWFYTTHQFHQSSSSHLKSAFLHGRDEVTSVDSGSVSKSRGKEYRTKKWKEGSFDKAHHHPVKALITGGSSGKRLSSGVDRTSELDNPRSTVTTSSSSFGLITGQSSSSKAKKNPNSIVAFESCSSGKRLNSGANRTSEFTVTTNSSFGQTNELLSMMKKMCLRKSYVARRATRVEIRNSSSSNNSSVGSSSNPSYGITPDSRNAPRMSHVAAKIKEEEEEGGEKVVSKNMEKQKFQCRDIRKALAPLKVNGSNLTLEIKEGEKGVLNNMRGVAKNTEKQKVQRRDTRKALAPLRDNGLNSNLVDSKEEIKKKGLSRSLTTQERKENLTQKKCIAAKSENATQKQCAVGGGDRKVVKKSVSGSVVAGTVCSKGKSRGRANLEKPKSLIHRAHFR